MKIKRKPVDDENVVLTEECSVIIQRKLPTKLNGPDRFIIPCTRLWTNYGIWDPTWIWCHSWWWINLVLRNLNQQKWHWHWLMDHLGCWKIFLSRWLISGFLRHPNSWYGWRYGSTPSFWNYFFYNCHDNYKHGAMWNHS